MPQQDNTNDCGVFACWFSYKFIEFANNVGYEFDFKKYLLSSGSLKFEQFDSISRTEVSKFRLDLRILIITLFDLKYKHKLEEIAVPDYVNHDLGIVVVGELKQLLFGKIITPRNNFLSSKHVAYFKSGSIEKTVFMSDVEMILARELYHKYEKFKPDKILNPQWSWKERDSCGVYRYFVGQKILSAFAFEKENVLCKVELDTGGTKYIVVNAGEDFTSDHLPSVQVFEHSSIAMKEIIENKRMVSKWIEKKPDDGACTHLLVNRRIRLILDASQDTTEVKGLSQSTSGCSSPSALPPISAAKLTLSPPGVLAQESSVGTASSASAQDRSPFDEDSFQKRYRDVYLDKL